MIHIISVNIMFDIIFTIVFDYQADCLIVHKKIQLDSAPRRACSNQSCAFISEYLIIINNRGGINHCNSIYIIENGVIIDPQMARFS